MLAETFRRILIKHLILDALSEHVRGKVACLLCRILNVLLVSRVLVVLRRRARRSPAFLRMNQVLSEDICGINLDETSVPIISDSASIVGFGNEILNGLPGDGLFAIETLRSLVVLILFAHVVREALHTHAEVRVVESVAHIPAERLKLLALNQQSVEPAQTVNGLAEGLIFFARNKLLANVCVQANHVWLDSSGRLLSHLD